MSVSAKGWGWVVLGWALAWTCFNAQAVAVDVVSVAPHDMRAWLLRIHDAARRQNYQGTFVVSGGGTVSSARVAHFHDGQDELERSESLNGPKRWVYRRNQVVHTVWPESRLVQIEQRTFGASFPELLQVGNDHITDFYRASAWTSPERVAGRTARVMVIHPKDAWRYGYKLWSDDATGLLLRLDVLSSRGEVLETSAFSDVELDIKSQAASVRRSIQSLASYQTRRPVLTPVRLEEEGWTLREGVEGFRQVSGVKRWMPEGDAPEKLPAQPQILQAIYADSLAHVSIFIEPFNASSHTQPQQIGIGATHTLTQRHGDWWLTLVGDVPPATLQRLAQGLQRIP